MRIAICDNSAKDAHLIKKLCLEDGPHLCDIYLSGNSLYDKYRNMSSSYDVIFLDIDMPGLNGIETGKEIRKLDKNVIIVFVTNYEQYAIASFSCEPFNYVLKPCKLDTILRILNKAKEKLVFSAKCHIIRSKSKTIRLPISEIYYVECSNKHVIYHTRTSFYDTIGKLSDAYNALKDYNFIQIHQGYIVNMEKISDFDDKFVILNNNFKVEISVRKRKETLLKYAEFVERSV